MVVHQQLLLLLIIEMIMHINLIMTMLLNNIKHKIKKLKY